MHVCTDHRNLAYEFAPLAFRPNSPRDVLSKVHRWAVHLSRFEFFINHIEGANNVSADMLTRWSKKYRAASAHRLAALYTDTVPSAHEVDTIAVEKIINEQQKHQCPAGMKKNDDGVYKKG